jgi:outer membrane biosynthesis protein TonB
MVFLPILLLAQPALEISGRDNNTPVRPGETILVIARSASTYTRLGLVGAAELKADQMRQAPPYQFSIQVPSDIVAGVYQLSAMGFRGRGDYDIFRPITIDVEPIWQASDDGSHLVIDAPGVSVDSGGVPVMHRAAIPYPREALAQGIGGIVVVEVTPDWEGRVQGSLALSGPEALRKEAIKTILTWHFAKKAGRKPRRITITYDPVEATRSAGINSAGEIVPLGGPSSSWQVLSGHTLRSINVIALSDDARTTLLSSLPIQPGQTANSDALGRSVFAVGNFDHDLKIWWMRLGTDFIMTITPPGFRLENAEPPVTRQTTSIEVHANVPQITPQRIRVAAAEQAAKLISKVDPVYPPVAKAAHIQGVVRLTAVLSNDGRVMLLQVLRGPPLLVPAVQEAVKQWTYSRTFVNGIPVEVVTEIEVEVFQQN